jgi:hypothetical protein
VDAVAERAKAEMEAGRWTQEHELLAVIAELTHASLVAFIPANSKHGKTIKPLRIQRPGAAEVEAVPTLTHKALMALMQEEVPDA